MVGIKGYATGNYTSSIQHAEKRPSSKNVVFTTAEIDGYNKPSTYSANMVQPVPSTSAVNSMGSGGFGFDTGTGVASTKKTGVAVTSLFPDAPPPAAYQPIQNTPTTSHNIGGAGPGHRPPPPPSPNSAGDDNDAYDL